MAMLLLCCCATLRLLPSSKGPKAVVLNAIAANTRSPSPATRDAVLRAAESLEELGGGVIAPIEGRWSLMYSTQLSSPAQRQPSMPGLLQPAIDATYSFFFKFAPFLAGAEEGARRASNEQVVDLELGKVCNTVRLATGSSQGVKLTVNGDVEEVAGSPDLRITFTEFQLSLSGNGPQVTVPLPRPVGSLRTTFCDAEMRISRGGRGGIFILRRLQDDRSEKTAEGAAT
ncbi:hypothetical protein AB1Y20_009254 [Prymnesium parvum]|uniref:Plastid lipid-associated protein/fibrillin conserved domain-containing protein n=1 Tax=Prymnesium parvum TaxID=97485 RepID=A0AB34K3P1_PRYPA